MTKLTLPGPFWLFGCGNMAGAMLDGWLAAGIDPAQLTVIRPSGKAVAAGVKVVVEPPRGEPPALVMLGMKPYQLDAVAGVLAPLLHAETILVSILGGVELASHRARFPTPSTIVRAMPNLPVRLGQGVTALLTDGPDAQARAIVGDLMAALGAVEWFEDERLFAVTTALSGSGPAFVYRFIDALAVAGARLGMPADQAQRITLATVAGAAALVVSEDEAPATLADRVASPRGSTRAGLDILDDGDALIGLLERTLAAAHRRSLEMAVEARTPAS